MAIVSDIRSSNWGNARETFLRNFQTLCTLQILKEQQDELHDKVLCYSKKSSASLSAFQVNSSRNVLCVFLLKKKTGQTVKNANACNTVQSSTLIIARESCEFDVNIIHLALPHSIWKTIKNVSLDFIKYRVDIMFLKIMVTRFADQSYRLRL